MTLDDLAALARGATPGPWVTSHGRHENVPYDIEAGHEALGPFTSIGWVLASIHEPWQRGVNGPPRVLNAAENAAYIAACSPEVIAALVSVAQVAERGWNDRNLPFGNVVNQGERLDAELSAALDALKEVMPR